jgi:hypothetical protein
VPEPKERAMVVWQSTEGLGLTEAGIKVFDDTGTSSEQQQTEREFFEGACVL